MDVNVIYKNRDLEFKSGSNSGRGLDGLLEFVKINKDEINVIEIKGESESYTFLRQIYLLANLLSEISGFEVRINGKLIQNSETVLPSYGR